jgi:hypothetical protein
MSERIRRWLLFQFSGSVSFALSIFNKLPLVGWPLPFEGIRTLVLKAWVVQAICSL